MTRWTGLEKIFFGAFLFWSAAGLVFTLGGIYPETVALWPGPGLLRNFVLLCLRTGDPLLILLAFANTHLHAARQWTPPVARRWALIVVAAAFAVETVGVWTGFPFGAYRYSDHFGPMLGVIPFTIPLAWHVVVTDGFFLVQSFVPRAARLVTALLTGLICAAYDFVLEPFATEVKHYWTWAGGHIPLRNYAAWFLLSALLTFLFAPARERVIRDMRPALLLAVTLLIFLAGSWRGGR
jgi:putative membrane protein